MTAFDIAINNSRKVLKKMSKAVMMSIQPKWCELISGKKTIEADDGTNRLMV